MIPHYNILSFDKILNVKTYIKYYNTYDCFEFQRQRQNIIFSIIYCGVKYRSYFNSKIRVNHVQDVQPSFNHVLACNVSPHTCRPLTTRRLHL